MSIFYDTTGYYGIIPFIFALLSLAYYFFFPRDSGDRDIRLVCGFFSVAALLLVMKRYGLAPIQWVGYLPILKMVFFFKYQEPLISFFLACLSGIGFSVLFTEKCKPKLINTVICVFALVFAGIAISAWSPGEKAGLTGQHSASFYSYCVLIILTLLTVSILSYRYLSSKKKYALYCFFILLVFELFFIFLYPFFYMKKGYLADKTADPYKGAPFIEFLKKENVDYSRVFGRDGVLYPNWASAFGLFDVRFLDAMLYDKYRNFVRYFFIDKYGDKEVPFTLELFDRFTGQDTVFEYDFRTYSEKRFLQLSSVKYLLTMKSLGKDVEDTAIGRMIYDDEIKIYETSDILPRASVFYGAKLSDNENQVLSILKNPGFDIRQEVMIYSKDLGNNERSRLETINSLPPRKSEPAKIVSYTSQSVSIEAELDRSGILMLNDSNYPGWKVSVDGQEEIMLNVNYLFRGVFLDKGKHIILFTYQPMSFYIGLCISVVTLMLMIAASFNISKSASRSNDIS
ncbi:MAG: YfhO family protein [Nitrospirae bacterium]|nr:YfhO family protein [Nitrospirota bacterium]